MNIPGRTFELLEGAKSEWFPRRGDYAIFRGQVVDKEGDALITIKILTKKTEDTGDGTEVGSFTLSGMAGTVVSYLATSNESVPLLKELVRYQINCTGMTGWMCMRTLTPVFFDAAVAL